MFAQRGGDAPRCKVVGERTRRQEARRERNEDCAVDGGESQDEGEWHCVGRMELKEGNRSGGNDQRNPRTAPCTCNGECGAKRCNDGEGEFEAKSVHGTIGYAGGTMKLIRSIGK